LWVAADAVGIELVSAPRFPVNREINRKFCRFRPSAAAVDEQIQQLARKFPMQANREFQMLIKEWAAQVHKEQAFSARDHFG
jgi:hypothetical protein